MPISNNYKCDGQMSFFECLDAMRDNAQATEGHEKQSNDKLQGCERKGLSMSTIKILEAAGITTIAELRKQTYNDLVRIRGMGARAMKEIQERLKGETDEQ